MPGNHDNVHPLTIKQVPIVVTTAADNNTEKYLSIGATAVLAKPFSIDGLVKMVSEKSRRDISSDCVDDTATVINKKMQTFYLGDDPEKKARLINAYLNALRENTNRLIIYSSGGNREKIAPIVHKLCSSSMSVGAERLSRALTKIESVGNSQSTEDLVEAVASLNDLIDKTYNALSAQVAVYAT